jgi:hypothetical protein
MNRRAFVTGLGAVLIVPLGAEAQQAGKVARVGFLSPGERSSRGWQADVLKEALRGHGWVEGENLVIEYRFGGERYERLRMLADELVRLKVDLIFASSAPAAAGGTEHTRAALRAALGFLALEPREPELRRLHRCFDNWRGIGDVVAGMAREEYDLELRRYN